VLSVFGIFSNIPSCEAVLTRGGVALAVTAAFSVAVALVARKRSPNDVPSRPVSFPAIMLGLCTLIVLGCSGFALLYVQSL
jgi:hypothetical protein